MTTELNEKQRRFAEEFLVDLNATQAAIRAGYSKRGAENTGWRLLRNARVQDFLDELRLERARATRTHVQNILNEIWFLYRMAWQTGKLSVAKGCLDMLGRHVTMFTDRHLVFEQNRYDDMTTEELQETELKARADMISQFRENPSLVADVVRLMLSAEVDLEQAKAEANRIDQAEGAKESSVFEPALTPFTEYECRDGKKVPSTRPGPGRAR